MKIFGALHQHSSIYIFDVSVQAAAAAVYYFYHVAVAYSNAILIIKYWTKVKLGGALLRRSSHPNIVIYGVFRSYDTHNTAALLLIVLIIMLLVVVSIVKVGGRSITGHIFIFVFFGMILGTYICSTARVIIWDIL